MITFVEHHGGYKSRTVENSFADLTIAFAMDFDTAGEKATRYAALRNGKYLAVDVSTEGTDLFKEQLHNITKALRGAKSLNIAGNGLYTLKKFGFNSQEEVDRCCRIYLEPCIESLKAQNEFKLILIRSGGQTGFDEAGLKLGEKLGIPTLCLAPKGWLFRDENENDIADEKLFKQRFQ